MDKSKISGLTTALNNLLTPHLRGFGDCKDYLDRYAWIKKAISILRAHPSPYILERILFSESLTRCLHKSEPFKNKEHALELYELVFRNMREAVEGDPNEYLHLMAEDLPLLTVGLLPFLQQAPSPLRRKTLALLRNYFLDLGEELVPLLPALLAAALPILEENDLPLKRDAFELVRLLH
jgi:hypothetical protein